MKKNIIILILTLLCLVLAVVLIRKPKTVENPPITITDTITQVQWDTCFLKEIKVVKMPVFDTITNDSIVTVSKIDSVFVEIPISKYIFDTTIVSDTTKFDLGLRLSGYDVSLDTLMYEFDYHPAPPEKKWRLIWGPMVGLGYNNGIVPTIGIGVSLKKL